MPSKTEEYLALAQRTANGLTRYWESWTDYLTTASRLYKYPFADQLMIYAQRPDAIACADYDVWNSRMNRYVRRSAKGIALLDESSGFPRLHYVFDVSDTGVRRNSRDPEVWQYNDDLKQPVSEMLAATYGISGERVSQQLADVAGKLVADYWDNNGGDIRAIVDLSQAEIEHELRKHGSGFQDGKQRIIELYQTQPDRKLRAKALAKEYGIGGHSHDYLDGSSGFVNHDWKGLEFDHYPDHQKITLKWAQVEKYIDLMIQSDRYLTDKEKEQRTARQEAECQLPMLDGTVATEYTALKEQYPNTLVGFELNGNYLFYDKDAVAVERILHTNLLSQENVLGKVKVTGFPSEQWAAESKKLWAAGNNVYLAGLNEDGSHHQAKYLREADYLPIGSIIKLDGRDFRVEHVNFTFKSVSLQDMELTKNRLPIFRNEHLPHIRELYEEQQAAAIDLVPEKEVSYKVGDEVVVDLPTRTIEGTVGYIGDTDVRIDTSSTRAV